MQKAEKRGPFQEIVYIFLNEWQYLMNPLLSLDYMLPDYSPLFKYKNFDHFRTLIQGLLNTPIVEQ